MAGSRKNIKNYDIKYKMDICEEYLNLIKQNPSISKKQFAKDKGIKTTTFYDWINTYSSYQNNKDNSEEISTSNNDLTPIPKFVRLSNNEDDAFKISTNKDVSLEFSDINIDMFMMSNLTTLVELGILFCFVI